MDNESTLSIVVRLQDAASAQLQAIADKVEVLGSKVSSAAESIGSKFSAMGKSMENAGQKMTSLGTSMSASFTLPLVAIGTLATKAAMDFDSAMLKIQTGAGASAKEVANLSKQFIQMAQNGAQQGPEELAKGMYWIESAGYHGADAMKVLKAAMDGANVSGVDLTTVSQQLGTAMNAMHISAADSEKTIALLNATVGQGVMNMDQLMGAYSTGILPKAAAVGLGIKDVNAALDTLTQNGMEAQSSATRLGMTFSMMLNPTTKAASALASIGMTSRQMADDMRNGGLVTALEDLNNHLNATQPAHDVLQKNTKLSATKVDELKQKIADETEKIKIMNETHIKSSAAVDRHNLSLQKANETLTKYQNQLAGAGGKLTEVGAKSLDATGKAQLLSEVFGGGRTSGAMLTLMQHIDKLKTNLNSLGDGVKKFSGYVQQQGETTEAYMARMKASSQAALIEVGNAMMPLEAEILPKLSKLLSNVANWFANLSPAMQENIIKFAALLAAIGPVLIILGTMITTFGKITSMIGSVTTVMAKLIPTLIGFAVANPILTAIVVVVGLLALAAYEVYAHWDVIKPKLIGLWNDIKTAFGNAWNWIKGVADTVITGIKNAIQDVINIWNSMKSLVSTPVNIITNAVSKVVSTVANATGLAHHAFGGFVDAPRGTEVPIIAHGGEEIIPAEQMSSRGGSNISIVINNPVVRRDSDITDIRNQINNLFREIMINHKVAHI